MPEIRKNVHVFTNSTALSQYSQQLPADRRTHRKSYDTTTKTGTKGLSPLVPVSARPAGRHTFSLDLSRAQVR